MAKRLPKSKKFKDRRFGLVLFGLLEAGLGLLLILFGAWLFSTIQSRPEVFGGRFAWVFLIYQVLGALWVVLGIGSILAKKWARALILMVSWFWLFVGVFATLLLLKSILFPAETDTRFHDYLSSSEVTAIFWGVAAFFFVGFVLLPLGLIFFYSSSNVKATCEAADPKESWTDRAPLPVLALSLLHAIGAIFLLPFMVFLNFTSVFLGLVVSGLWGALLMVFYSGVQGYLAWGIYHRQIRAWWINLGYYLLIGISTCFLTSDKMLEMNRQMGMSEDTIARMHQDGSNAMAPWMGTISMAVMMGYLFYIKRYFPVAKVKSRSRARGRSRSVIKK